MEDLKIKVKEILISNDFELIGSNTNRNSISVIIKKDEKTIKCEYKTLNKGADIEIIKAKYI